MLKTSSTKSDEFRKGMVRVGDGSKAGRDKSEIDGGEVDVNEIKEDEVKMKVQKTSKSKNLSKSKKTVGFSDFFTLRAKLAFTKLRQAFFKTPILYHFDPKCHIQMKINALGYAIGRVFSQPTLDDLDQWYPVAFFF